MTKRAYGKSRGITHVRVHQLVQEGKLTLVYGKIDPDQADAELAITLDPRRRMQRKLGTGESSTAHKHELTQAAKDAMALRRAQTRREEVKADMAELELKRRSGEMIDRRQTVRAFFTLFRVTRDAVLNCSPRLSALVAVEKNRRKCQKIIDGVLKDALSKITAEQLEEEL